MDFGTDRSGNAGLLSAKSWRWAANTVSDSLPANMPHDGALQGPDSKHCLTLLGAILEPVVELLERKRGPGCCQGSYPVWEDFINKAGKLQSQLRTTVVAAAAFLDAFQKVADMATNTRGEFRCLLVSYSASQHELPWLIVLYETLNKLVRNVERGDVFRKLNYTSTCHHGLREGGMQPDKTAFSPRLPPAHTAGPGRLPMQPLLCWELEAPANEAAWGI
ncbi:hypothetical protein A6R68_08964 [Neotoma lepida]|uniref:IMD domain-containing protein n=1 Tax=Neotoma lepida TaxID=56216 RepID=A0A1A6G240_NEOLE|nr:hypothetical protein A6R68_08964 [Neotoma lepida]